MKGPPGWRRDALLLDTAISREGGGTEAAV